MKNAAAHRQRIAAKQITLERIIFRLAFPIPGGQLISGLLASGANERDLSTCQFDEHLRLIREEFPKGSSNTFRIDEVIGNQHCARQNCLHFLRRTQVTGRKYAGQYPPGRNAKRAENGILQKEIHLAILANSNVP